MRALMSVTPHKLRYMCPYVDESRLVDYIRDQPANAHGIRGALTVLCRIIHDRITPL